MDVEMIEQAVRVALSDILPSDETMINRCKRNGFKGRDEWWRWMQQEYGAEKDGTMMSKRFGYGSVAVKFPNRESYTRYCLQWM